MAISKTKAVAEAENQIQRYRDVSESDIHLQETHNASGRWRMTFNVDGVHGRVVVRLDDRTGNLAAKEGHDLTSENLIP